MQVPFFFLFFFFSSHRGCLKTNTHVELKKENKIYFICPSSILVFEYQFFDRVPIWLCFCGVGTTQHFIFSPLGVITLWNLITNLSGMQTHVRCSLGSWLHPFCCNVLELQLCCSCGLLHSWTRSQIQSNLQKQTWLEVCVQSMCVYRFYWSLCRCCCYMLLY